MPDIPSGPVVGKDCKLYYNSSIHATPAWVEINKARNVSASLDKTKVDISARFSSWKASKSGLKDLEITFTYLHIRGTDTVFDKILDSFINDTAVQFLMLDGDVTLSKAQGPRAYCEVFSLNPSQELEGGDEYEVTIAPTYKEDPAGTIRTPDWYEVP